MLTAALVVLGVILYLHVGYHLGDISLKIWLDKDKTSPRSFLLFPVSYEKGAVGEWDGPPIASFDLLKKRQDSTGPTGYKVWMTFIWPLKVLVNVPAVLLYGGIRAAKAVRGRGFGVLVERKIDPDYLLPSGDDDIQAFFARRAVALDRIAVLVEKKRAIDEELERRKAEIGAVFEVEATTDPEIRQLVSGKKESA